MKYTVSKNVNVELNGKEIAIPQGTMIQINKNKSYFIVDEDVKIFANNKCILLEADDFIEISGDGKYEISSDCEISSNNQKFMLESGDHINILEGEGWETFKNKLKQPDLAVKQIRKVQNLWRRIVQKAERIYGYQQERGKVRSDFTSILNSDEWHIFREIASSDGPDSAEDIIDASGKDIKTVVYSLANAFKNVGQANLSKMLNVAVPKSFLEKLSQIWTESEPEETELTQKPQKIVTTKDGSKYLISMFNGKVIAIPMDKENLVMGDHYEVIYLKNGGQGIKINDEEIPFVKVNMEKIDDSIIKTVKSTMDVKSPKFKLKPKSSSESLKQEIAI